MKCYEMLDETCGEVVDKNDVDTLVDRIIAICCNKCYSEDACVRRAAIFDRKIKFAECVDLYGKFE